MRKILSVMAFAGLAAAPMLAGAAVDFDKDIAPIFQESCLKCHGPDKQKGNLRLDSKAAAFKGGKGGVVIIPGQADKSDLYRRVILPEGDDDFMPSKGDPLAKKQTDLIRDWINEGANWPETTVAKTGDAAGEGSPYEKLTPVKASAEETAAIAKVEATGVLVCPLATNLPWREISFCGRGTNVTDASLVALKSIPSLVGLNLGGTKITDAGLKNIEGLTNLVTLHLEQTQIGDAGIAHLKGMSHLVYLNLYGTAVTDAGVESLKGLASLRQIYLWQTKVTAQGAEDLKKALPKLAISRGWENEPAAEAAQAKPADTKDAKK